MKEAHDCFQVAALEFDRLGKTESGAIASRLAEKASLSTAE